MRFDPAVRISWCSRDGVSLGGGSPCKYGGEDGVNKLTNVLCQGSWALIWYRAWMWGLDAGPPGCRLVCWNSVSFVYALKYPDLPWQMQSAPRRRLCGNILLQLEAPRPSFELSGLDQPFCSLNNCSSFCKGLYFMCSKHLMDSCPKRAASRCVGF